MLTRSASAICRVPRPWPSISKTSSSRSLSCSTGLSGGDGLQSARSALGFAANGQVGLLIDEVRQPLAHERVVVHEEHLSFRFGGRQRHGSIRAGGCKFSAAEG